MKNAKAILLTAMLIAVMVLISSCGNTGSEGAKATSPFTGRDTVDLSDYHGMDDYDGESQLVETDVAEMVKLINDKETFVVFFSFADCPYCNLIIPYVNRVSEEEGIPVGYIDTRRDPSWMSNMDIEGYDMVVKYFGDFLEVDEQGKKHLYTPDMFFIKNGKVVARHDGVVEGADDSEKPLTSSQEEELIKILTDDFEKLR